MAYLMTDLAAGAKAAEFLQDAHARQAESDLSRMQSLAGVQELRDKPIYEKQAADTLAQVMNDPNNQRLPESERMNKAASRLMASGNIGNVKMGLQMEEKASLMAQREGLAQERQTKVEAAKIEQALQSVEGVLAMPPEMQLRAATEMLREQAMAPGPQQAMAQRMQLELQQNPEKAKEIFTAMKAGLTPRAERIAELRAKQAADETARRVAADAEKVRRDLQDEALRQAGIKSREKVLSVTQAQTLIKTLRESGAPVSDAILTKAGVDSETLALLKEIQHPSIQKLKDSGVPIISGVRTPEQQDDLRDHRGPDGKWLTKDGLPVADASKHLTGNAIDVDMKKATPEHIQQLKADGWTQPLPEKDSNHWEKAGGGGTVLPPKAAKSSATSSRESRYSDVVAIAANEAIGSIKNLVSLPMNVTSGVFGTAKPSGSLFNAPLSALANTITQTDSQRYNAEVKNIGKFFARLISGGLQITQQEADSFTDQYSIKEGDGQLTKLTKLAQMRLTFQRAADVKLTSRSTPPEQIAMWTNGIEDIKKAIPITVAEVNAIANMRDKKKTIGEALAEAKGSLTGAAAAKPGSGTKDDPIKLD